MNNVITVDNVIYAIAAISVLGGIVSLFFGKGPRSFATLLDRFAVISFALLNVMTGLMWVLFPGRFLTLLMGGIESTLVFASVQVRGAFEVMLALIALAGIGGKSRGVVSACLALSAYNLLMGYTAVTAQFTGFIIPSRWVDIALFLFWAGCFGFKAFNSDPTTVQNAERACPGEIVALLCFAIWSIGFGTWLYALEVLRLDTPLLSHSAQSLGAEYIGFGACAVAAAIESDSRGRRIVMPPLIFACLAVSLITAGAGVPPPGWEAFQRLLMVVHLGLMTGLFAAWRISQNGSLWQWLRMLPGDILKASR